MGSRRLGATGEAGGVAEVMDAGLGILRPVCPIGILHRRPYRLSYPRMVEGSPMKPLLWRIVGCVLAAIPIAAFGPLMIVLACMALADECFDKAKRPPRL